MLLKYTLLYCFILLYSGSQMSATDVLIWDGLQTHKVLGGAIPHVSCNRRQIVQAHADALPPDPSASENIGGHGTGTEK